MAKSMKLLLTENVENLGIVGDVVNVRLGYARNYLLPRGLVTEPSEDAVRALAVKREQAEKQLREIRGQREQLIGRLSGVEVTIQRSCNDQGLLYGSITQRDISDALEADGFNIKPRDVRLGQVIKRVDSYPVLIKLDRDLEAEVKVWVVPDRELELDRREVEFDREGNVVDKKAASAAPEVAAEPEGEKKRPSRRAKSEAAAE